jgi:hypothetical protein
LLPGVLDGRRDDHGCRAGSGNERFRHQQLTQQGDRACIQTAGQLARRNVCTPAT